MLRAIVYLVFCGVVNLLVRSSAGAVMQDKVESLVLRHQLKVLQRQVPGAGRFGPADRALLAGLTRVLRRDRWRVFLVKPQTSLWRHREVSQRRWRRWRATE